MPNNDRRDNDVPEMIDPMSGRHPWESADQEDNKPKETDFSKLLNDRMKEEQRPFTAILTIVGTIAEKAIEKILAAIVRVTEAIAHAPLRNSHSRNDKTDFSESEPEDSPADNREQQRKDGEKSESEHDNTGKFEPDERSEDTGEKEDKSEQKANAVNKAPIDPDTSWENVTQVISQYKDTAIMQSINEALAPYHLVVSKMEDTGKLYLGRISNNNVTEGYEINQKALFNPSGRITPDSLADALFQMKSGEKTDISIKEFDQLRHESAMEAIVISMAAAKAANKEMIQPVNEDHILLAGDIQRCRESISYEAQSDESGNISITMNGKSYGIEVGELSSFKEVQERAAEISEAYQKEHENHTFDLQVDESRKLTVSFREGSSRFTIEKAIIGGKEIKELENKEFTAREGVGKEPSGLGALRKALRSSGWDLQKESKGAWIFSADAALTIGTIVNPELEKQEGIKEHEGQHYHLIHAQKDNSCVGFSPDDVAHAMLDIRNGQIGIASSYKTDDFVPIDLANPSAMGAAVKDLRQDIIIGKTDGLDMVKDLDSKQRVEALVRSIDTRTEDDSVLQALKKSEAIRRMSEIVPDGVDGVDSECSNLSADEELPPTPNIIIDDETVIEESEADEYEGEEWRRRDAEYIEEIECEEAVSSSGTEQYVPPESFPFEIPDFEDMTI